MTDASATPYPVEAWLTYPRPQLVRPTWASLDGPWGFTADDADQGRDLEWWSSERPFQATIQVPFPPEAPASGIGDRDFHPVVWYRREITADDVRRAGGTGERLLLHFGAVDYRADVWLGGRYVGRHEGGHTPFTFDVTEELRGLMGSAALVVRAEDDPEDVAQPRGKQDWQPTPHGIWYERSTGIWQPVWLEAASRVHVTGLLWTADVVAGTVTLELDLGSRPSGPAEISIVLRHADVEVASARYRSSDPRSTSTITLPHQANGQAYERLLWSPEHPRLLDAEITVVAESGEDHVYSYLGLRSVGWAAGHFLLNDRPYYLRSVLTQGYWPDTHIAAPSAEALRDEVQLIKDLGFNAVRVHQKIEDPRFLAWADRLGLLVWGETPSTFEFSRTAVHRLTREWMDVLRRDGSHPSIVTWVPFNESWGVQHVAHDPAQLAFVQSLYQLTKALDPTRLVVTNDGWEHAGSDLLTVHDYGTSRGEVEPNYSDRATVTAMLRGIGPLGRRMQLTGFQDEGRPVIVSEFGGVSYAPDHSGNGWGYATVERLDEFERLIRDLFAAVQSSPVLAGFCYTQLADTLQEANGLVDGQRRPKLPVEVIRAIVRGDTIDTTAHRRPKKPVERPLAID